VEARDNLGILGWTKATGIGFAHFDLHFVEGTSQLGIQGK
jgi:hypothetical protein